MRAPYCFLVKMLMGTSCFMFYLVKFSCRYKNHSFLLLPKEVTPPRTPPAVPALRAHPGPGSALEGDRQLHPLLSPPLVSASHSRSDSYISSFILFSNMLFFGYVN